MDASEAGVLEHLQNAADVLIGLLQGASIEKKDASRLDKLLRKAGSVVGVELDTHASVAGSCQTRIIHRIHSTTSSPGRATASLAD